MSPVISAFATVCLSVLQLLYLALPGILANIAPVICKRWSLFSSLDAPLDGGRTWRGRRLLGPNKTWRGLWSGVLVGGFTASIQWLLHHLFPELGFLEVVNYDSPTVVLMGLSMGFGAIAGDAVKSFCKRQRDIPSGDPWRPWDNVDSMIGVYLFTLPFYIPTPQLHLTALIVAPLLHYSANILGYRLGIKNVPH